MNGNIVQLFVGFPHFAPMLEGAMAVRDAGTSKKESPVAKKQINQKKLKIN